MKALTLYQPWASLIAIGAKAHETRDWETSYRGPLLIHASQKWDMQLVRLCYGEPFFEVLHQSGVPFPARCDAANKTKILPLGAIVASCRLVDCQPTSESRALFDTRRTAIPRDPLDEAFGDWSPGRFAWGLKDVRPLPEPIPWKGAQGLWNVSPELAELVHEQLEAAP